MYCRFISPSLVIASSPNVSFICSKAVDPFSTAFLEAISASTILNPYSDNNLETVDFPVAIPPVNPITLGICITAHFIYF